jgi:D-lactate dehydrogenase
MDETLIAWLSTLDLFEHVSPETLRAIAAACAARSLPAGETLFREGDPGAFLFFVRSGTLNAFVDSGGRPSLLRALAAGDWGGLTSIMLAQPRSASLRAESECTLYTIGGAEVLALLAARPDFARALIAALSRKQRTKTQHLAKLLEAPGGGAVRIAFYDAKPYDKQSFEPLLGRDLACTWLAMHLDRETAELANGHRVVCAFVNDDLSGPTLERLASLGVELVALRCAGFNNVDLKTAGALGISVARVPAYSPHAVAEHALALLMTLNRSTHRAFNRVREGNFSLTGLVGSDLYGRTAGVVGLGKIGRCAATILRGLGMRVLGYDIAIDPAFAEREGIEPCTLEDLLRQSDVITLHAPLLPATHHMINALTLALTKRGVILINTSRGGLIESKALIDALKSGQIAAAGLDVYEEESDYFFEDHSSDVIGDDLLARLMTFNNVLITSHQAFLTHQALANIAETTLGNVRQFLSGSAALENRVV